MGMGERDHYAPGTFCWAELGTADPEGATAFYVGLLGWEAVDMAAGNGANAATFRLRGRDVCALQRHDPRQGPPGWRCYVSVDGVDQVTKRAVEAGATIVQEPLDVYAAARTAVIADPTGAVTGLWEPRQRVGATLVNDPGAMCLNQLNTSDPDRAAAFYTEVFGWRITPVGTAEQPYWGIHNGDALNGGMMPLPPGAGPSHWLAYFTTTDIDAAAERILALGAPVLVKPMAVPGGRILVAVDPQGAAFAMFQGRTDP
jgi:uncharacterized protein